MEYDIEYTAAISRCEIENVIETSGLYRDGNKNK
jgi:hypothetical protein